VYICLWSDRVRKNPYNAWKPGYSRWRGCHPSISRASVPIQPVSQCSWLELPDAGLQLLANSSISKF
jgi:hypothetical protein